MNAKVYMAWSCGKDSAWALYQLRRQTGIQVTGLLSTVTADYQRVSMHGVRRSLLERQAESLGLPLCVVEIPAECSDETYANRMGEAMEHLRAQGVTHMAFGDLFLEDVRRYREKMLAGIGIEALFPLWGQPTARLARQIVRSGVRAVITCVDPRTVPADLAGCAYDRELIDNLPKDVDPCAENGEFHTFVWDGPMFTKPIKIRSGPAVERDNFVFADVVETDPDDETSTGGSDQLT